jgi:hypothetical protein
MYVGQTIFMIVVGILGFAALLSICMAVASQTFGIGDDE